MDTPTRQSAVKIGLQAFVLSALIILLLMIGSGILTIVLPAGRYDRIVEDGRTLVINGSYREISRPDYPFWRWFTAPLEVLAGPENLTPIVLIIFIIVVGGSIAVLERAGVMEALVQFLVARFSSRKYLLIALMILFFMVVASFVGIYEGMVPMIVFIIPIAVSMGFDTMTGLGMSLLPLSFGFASAVTNPFTIAVAQRIADLPLFSGAWLRLIFFVTIYALVTFFVISHARKVAANPRLAPCHDGDQALRRLLGAEAGRLRGASGEKRVWKALIWFTGCIGLAMIIVIATARSARFSALAFPVMAALFLAGGAGGGFFSGLGAAGTAAAFGRGALNILPGVVLVLMAYSVKQIITAGMIMDTILFGAAELIRQSPPLAAAFLIYAATLIMNFFIGSASAKAFLMMPLLTPLADLVGVTRQTAIMAFNFGDGFSNMIFPTNALLLIGLSLSPASYTKWMVWTWKLQLAVLAVTSLFLYIAVAASFGPF